LVQAGAGAVMTVSGLAGVATGSATCLPTVGAGCAVVAGGVGATLYGADQVSAGVKTVWEGADQATLGGTLSAAALGISPQAGEALYGLAGLTPMVIKGGAIVVGKLGVATTSVLDAAATKALVNAGGVIDSATGLPILDMKVLTSAQKGVMGDLFGESLVKQIVPDGKKIARTPGIGETGLDDLYQVNRPDVDYVVIEYKFVSDYAKTGAQVLKSTADGTQGSQSWITGAGRIEKAVGDIEGTAVRNAIRSGRVESWVVTVRPDGSTFVQVLDAAAKAKPIDTSKIILPSRNLSGAQP
jgi:filamentous hemagglutinin